MVTKTITEGVFVLGKKVNKVSKLEQANLKAAKKGHVKQIELIYKLLGMLIDRQEVEQTVKDKRDNDSIQKDIERLSALLDEEKDEETRLN